MLTLLNILRQNENGQGLVEYALLIALIALVVVLALMLIAPQIGNAFSEVGSAME